MSVDSIAAVWYLQRMLHVIRCIIYIKC